MGIKLKQKMVWTMVRNSFMMMGGNSHYPGGTKVDVVDVRKLKGLEFFSFHTARGTLRIAESQSGGIICDTWEDLIDNIEGCTKKFLQDQIKAGQPKGTIKIMDKDEFFKHYKF